LQIKSREEEKCDLLRDTKLFYSRPGWKSESYLPAPALSKPEQSIDNKKNQQGEKKTDQMNYTKPEIW